MPRAAFDIGTTFRLHSGAWRAWSAPVDEQPARVPVALPAPEAPDGVAAEAAIASDQSAPIRPSADGEPGTASPAAPAGFVALAETAAPTEAEAPSPPTPSLAEGRMALAGPESRAAPAAEAAHTSPKRHDRPPGVQAPVPADNKFGPAIFKQFDGKGS
jgi:hypothetical protein